MRIGTSVDGALEELVAAEVASGERVVTRAMRQTGTQLKANWQREITGAGLGGRLARAIRSRTFPERG